MNSRIGTSARIAAIALALVVVARPALAQTPGPLRVPASVLERYTGEWIYPDGETITVVVENGALFREIPGQKVPFVPISETLFRLGPVFTAEFVLDGKGGASQILTDGTVEYRLRRRGSPPAATPNAAPAVKLALPVLQRYVGTYEYIPGQMSRTDLRIVIWLKGDTLIRQMGGDQAILTPISETRFRVGSTSLTTEFVVDDAGVTQVSGQGFQQLLSRLTSKR